MSTVAPFRIAVCGIEELPEHGERDVTHVLSILDPDWPVPLAFGRFGEHEKLELRFDDVIEDLPRKTPPREEHVVELLAFGRTLMAEPAEEVHLLVHCHAGVSRSTASLILMVAQARPELPASAITNEILRIRPIAWPNLRLIEFGDRLLRRDGEIVSAVRDLYRSQLARDPEIAFDRMADNRGREVALARDAAK